MLVSMKILAMLVGALALAPSAAAGPEAQAPKCPPASLIDAAAGMTKAGLKDSYGGRITRLNGPGWNLTCKFYAVRGAGASKIGVTVDISYEVGIDRETFDFSRGLDKKRGAVVSTVHGVGDAAYGATFKKSGMINLVALAGITRVTVISYFFDNTAGVDRTLPLATSVAVARKVIELLPAVAMHDLRVRVNGKGVVSGGSISCPGACSTRRPEGTKVTLTAKAAAGWVFQNWAGDCRGAGSCSVTLREDADVTAVFVRR